ncbi:MAG: glycerate kinase [Saccharofermentanales bacterium]
MKIVIAPDSFKGTMSSREVCDIMADAIKCVYPDAETIKIPVSDGGEGLVDAITASVGGRKVKKIVKGPDFSEVEAEFGISEYNETAIIEMAAASGLLLMKGHGDPWNTTTYGTGQLIIDAVDKGCRKIILGIGGSATNDGGVGMAAAFGVRFLDSSGNEIPLTGGGLENIAAIDSSKIDKRLDDVEISVACDVDNILCGESGASFIFAPQKGADAQMVKKLDANLQKFVRLLNETTGKKIDDIPGTGAAGGIAASLLAFTNAHLEKGIKIVLDCVGFDKSILGADYIFTGEGKIDSQSLRGKVVDGVARRGAIADIPVIVIAGGVDIAENEHEEFYKRGISAIFSTMKVPETFEEMKPKCKKYLFDTVVNVSRLL